MPLFDVADLLVRDYTPAVKNLWKITFPSLGGLQIPSFLAKSTSRPQWTFEDNVIDYMSQKRYFAGKVEFQQFDCIIIEPIDAFLTDAIMAWTSLVQEFNTGLRGYVSMYKKNLTLELLDGVKNSIQKWVLIGSWIVSTNLGDLDYTDSNTVDVTLTFRYDWPRREY